MSQTTQKTTDSRQGEMPPRRVWIEQHAGDLHAFQYRQSNDSVEYVRADLSRAPLAAVGGDALRNLLNQFLLDKYGCTIEHYRMKVLKHFVEWAAPAAAASSLPAERFVVHEPTGVVECNDSACPLGSTIVGWPHTFGEGCMYAATVLPAAELSAGPRCPKCGYVMCEQFDSRPVNALADIVTPNGTYICYRCTTLPAEPPPNEAHRCPHCGRRMVSEFDEDVGFWRECANCDYREAVSNAPAEPEGEQEFKVREAGSAKGGCLDPDDPAVQRAIDGVPLCPVHKSLDERDELVPEIGNNCVACSLHERTELLNVLEPFASPDGTQDSVTVLRNAIARATSPATPSDAAMRAAREWMNTHHASFETNKEREDALAAIITRHLAGTTSVVRNYDDAYRRACAVLETRGLPVRVGNVVSEDNHRLAHAIAIEFAASTSPETPVGGEQ